jgi:hypothetical protein
VMPAFAELAFGESSLHFCGSIGAVKVDVPLAGNFFS